MIALTLYYPEGSAQVIEIGSEVVTLGRLDDNTVVVPDASISSHHAQLAETEDGLVLEDLESTNGTKVNGERIEGAVLVQPGDQIVFGSVAAVLEVAELAMAPQASIDPNEDGAQDQAGRDAESPGGAPELVAAETSARPESFASASPFPKLLRKKDPLLAGMFSLAGIAFLVFAASLYFSLSIQSPL